MSDIPESLQHFHGALAVTLRERKGLPGNQALDVASLCIEVLRRIHGGYRLGPRGLYIPAIDDRRTRGDQIREMLGSPPHSRARVREAAIELECSEITVWRALRRGRE
jgi:hypothetical protein